MSVDIDSYLYKGLKSLGDEEWKALDSLLDQCGVWGDVTLPVRVKGFSESEANLLSRCGGEDNIVGLQVEDSHIVKALFNGCGCFSDIPEEFKYFTNLKELYLVYVNLSSISNLNEYCPQLEKLFIGPNPIRKLCSRNEIMKYANEKLKIIIYDKEIRYARH